MAEKGFGERLVLWPDLSRFGAALNVAFNPSVGQNFLKFSVLDRETFELTSGATGDLNWLMRQAGFSLCSNETRINQTRAYNQAVAEGLQYGAIEDAQRAAREAIFFYSPTLAFTRDRLKTFLPSLEDGDLRQVKVGSVKHLDFRFVDEVTAGRFIRQQQELTGAEPGVFFTTPGDRALAVSLAQTSRSLNELLEYRDLPPAASRDMTFSGDLAAALVFHPVSTIERAMRRQTIGIDGLPLRAPTMKGALIGYATRELAVAANRGDTDGVETVKLPHGVPVGFAAHNGRLLVVKDARFLELDQSNLPDLDAVMPVNVQRNLDFLGHVAIVEREFQSLNDEGLLDPASWTTLEIVAGVKQRFEEIFRTMRVALAPTMPQQGFFTVDAIARLGGQRAARFEQHFAPGFLPFVDDFRTKLYNAAQRVHDELQSAITLKDNLTRVLRGAASSGSRREDAGEKIGGARKDFSRQALRRSEVADLSVRERIEIVSKENVWPRLDLEAMRERGVEPHVAFVIRAFRNALPANPGRGGRNRSKDFLERRSLEELSVERCDAFIRSVELVRDCLASVKTEDELHQACFEICRQADLPIRIRPVDGDQTPRTLSGSPRNMFWNAEHWFHDGAGQRFTDTVLPEVVYDEQTGRARGRHRLTQRLAAARTSTDGGWAWAVKERMPRADGAPQVEVAAPAVPHLEEIVRIGPDHRQGADVDEARFMATFGFRGIEYGLWLPQAERQLVLNHAYDALMDLAGVVSLPPSALSLGGELAVAFGARGLGGKEAAEAHFEPARRVMNFTRLRGAGKLAHEWWHALDDWLARNTGLSGGYYATEMLGRLRGQRGVRPPAMSALVSDLETLLAAAKTVTMPLDEVLEQHSTVQLEQQRVRIDAFVERRLLEWVSTLDRMLPEERRDAAFRDLAIRAMSSHWVGVPGFEAMSLRRFSGIERYIESVSRALDVAMGSPAWREHGGMYLNHPPLVISMQDRLLKKLTAVRDRYTPDEYRKNSRFFNDALAFDEQCSKPYWSTDVELSARVFEAWVQDRIQADGERRSDYLVCGTDDLAEARQWIYPCGDERIGLNERMTAYIDRHRQELSRRLASSPRQAPTTSATISSTL